MNATLITQLAEFVDTLPARFRSEGSGALVPLDPPAGADESTVIYDQGCYVERTACGTAACIAGALALMVGDPLVIRSPYDTVRPPDPYESWTRYVSDKLGIGFDLADLLTDTEIEGVVSACPTPEQAAQAIRNLLDCSDGDDPWSGVGVGEGVL